MSIKNVKIPPIILRLINEPLSALENLLPLKMLGPDSVSQPNLPIPTEENFDRFILSQFLMYLYVNIFVFSETSFVYKKLLENNLSSLKTQIPQIKDKNLRDLIQSHMSIEDVRTPEGSRLLESTILRVRPTDGYPTLSNIITIVLSTYGRWRPFEGTTVVHRISLQKIDGYDEPAFVLTPCFDTVIDTEGLEQIPSLFWKLMFSFHIQDHLTAPGDLSHVLLALATLALPLDPMSLTNQMRKSMSSNAKAGIPFINYLAMYMRECNMGLDYNLSPMADSRRILMKRVHQFCGVGGTCISDFTYANAFLDSLYASEDNRESTSYSEEDCNLLRALQSGRPNDVVQFTKRMVYEEAVEAAKPVDDPTKKPTDTTDDAPAVDNTVDDGFPDDSKTLDTSTDTPDDSNTESQPISENGDDNIDRTTSDVGQKSAAAKLKVFLPLALPTETIDDHLLRLMVLRYVDDMENDPSPSITSENLETLKYWCDSWLFIASIDQTKKLLAQMNINGQMKELVV